MSRVARVVVPEIPHHITQRGNRQAAIFETDEDRLAFLPFFEEVCGAAWLVRVGLLPDDQPCSSCRGTRPRGFIWLWLARHPHGIRHVLQQSYRLFRSRVAGAVLLLSLERAAFVGGGALCEAQPGGGGDSGARRSLSLVECWDPLPALLR